MIFGLLKEWIGKIKDYDRIEADNIDLAMNADDLHHDLNSKRDVIVRLEAEIIDLEALNQKPDVYDSEYWNGRWPKKTVYYSAPRRKNVVLYLKDRKITVVNLIVEEILHYSKFDSADEIPLAVMKWVEAKGFKYKFDESEHWNTPEETMKAVESGTDCDDIAILEYYIIRKILKTRAEWTINKHRLKLWDGWIYKPTGTILRPGYRHVNCIWLAEDTQWYTIESTWYLKRAINNWLRKPMKKERMYGAINFTFNEEYCWSPLSLTMKETDYRK